MGKKGQEKRTYVEEEHVERKEEWRIFPADSVSESGVVVLERLNRVQSLLAPETAPPRGVRKVKGVTSTLCFRSQCCQCDQN